MTGEKNRFKTTEKLWDLDDKQLKSPVHDAMVLWLMDEDNLKALLFKHCNKDLETVFDDKEYDLNECLDVCLEVESEKPIMSSPTFIAGYADLIVSFGFIKYVSKETCPIPKKWFYDVREIKYREDMEELLKKYHNDESFEMKHFSEGYQKVYLYEENGEITESPYSFSVKGKDFEIKYKYPTTNWGDTEIDKFELFGDFVMNIIPNDFDGEYISWMREGNKYLKEVYGCNCLIEVKPYIDSFGAVLRQINSYKRFYNGREYVRISHSNGKESAVLSPTKYCLFTFDNRFDKQFESQGIIVLHPWTSKQEMLEMYGLG